jgi:hypothetical protein
MRVTVKLYATLSDYLPAGSKNNRVEIEVAEKCYGQRCFKPIFIAAQTDPSGAFEWRFCSADERAASVSCKDGDVLAVWPPIAGG